MIDLALILLVIGIEILLLAVALSRQTSSFADDEEQNERRNTLKLLQSWRSNDT
jgi:hypothetical protein